MAQVGQKGKNKLKGYSANQLKKKKIKIIKKNKKKQKPPPLHKKLIQKVGGLHIKKKLVFGGVRGLSVKVNREIKVWYKEKKNQYKKE